MKSIETSSLNILAFDIETVPDVSGLRNLYHLPPVCSDEEVVSLARQRRRAESGGEFMPIYLQKVIAIACCFRWHNKIRVASLGAEQDSEKQLLQKFFDIFERYSVQLVSWNGNGFDLPVLYHRSLIHRVSAPKYWEWGEQVSEYRWNNYLNRFHFKHCDLMDLLAKYQLRASAPLDAMAKLCGLPGKLGMEGSQVWEAYQRGHLQAIRSYCEIDVLNTYLLFLRFQFLRGNIQENKYQSEISLLREYLETQATSHFLTFLENWTER
ncbi:MAG: 3'-5' exonuclease [Neisseriaceae bacterium]